MRRRRISTTTLVAILAAAIVLGGCGLAGTPESGWVWPTTGPVTPAPTPLRVTPAVLLTPTARVLSPATAVVATATATDPETPTVAPSATETTTPLPSDTPAPPTETLPPPTEPAPTATAVPPTEPAPTETVAPPTATIARPTSTPVRGKVMRPTAGLVTAVATARGPLPVIIDPTPTATPAFPLPADLRSAWRDYPSEYGEVSQANPLGQPVEAPRSEQVSRQFFPSFTAGACSAGYALFLWRESTDDIYFLVGDNGPEGATCVDYWEAYPDTWATGQGNNEDLVPPAGRYTPVMGFGRVWREYFHGRSDGGLGFAVTPEQYTTATVQRFENGTAFHFPDTGEVYVLFDLYRGVGPGGEFTYRAWFRNP